jgi:hypothetical protein
VISVIPVLDYRHPANGEAVRVVESRNPEGHSVGGYVALSMDVQDPSSGGISVLELRFKDSVAMYDFFSGAGPIGQAIVRHNVEIANRPVNIVERAFEGTFADDRARAEIIVRDLVDAGHLPKKALEDL